MENGSIEISASSVEDAIEEGLSQLGWSRSQVEIEVLDPGSRGLLGFGARDAIVRLTPSSATSPAATPAQATKPEPIPSQEIVETETSVKEPVETTPSEPPATELDWSSDQVTSVARETLTEVLHKMGIDCSVSARIDEPVDDEPAPVTLDIEGEDLESLIGRQGEVLNALQYITRLIVSREVAHWVNLVVDVDGYKIRRSKTLKNLATKIAERVARTKQPVALEPMPPNERRAVHIALRDHPAVTTQSVGKGDRRKVTIIPRR
jgi:spoIIIJ-associated protein